MFALKYIGLSCSKHPDITVFQKSLYLALESYAATPEGTLLSEETQLLGRQMVQQFLELRQNGLTVSLLFFLAEPFIEASKSHDARLEKAVCRLLEDHSWVYNRKALIVLRDLAAERKSVVGMAGTFDTACYHSLKASFSEFLTESGDPILCARGLSAMETLGSLLFGIKPSEQDRRSLQRSVSLRPNGEKKDSSLFGIITRYLNMEGDSHLVQKQKEALESELEQQTIYSRRLLHIIAHSEIENGVGLEQFLASEYLSLRPKIVSAILDSANTSLLPILLIAEKLSKDPDEDSSLKTRTLHKLLAANTDTLYKDFAMRLVRGGDSELLSRVFTLYDEDAGPITALKMTCLKALCKKMVVLGANTQDALSQWIAQTMFLPFAQPLPVLPLPIVKQIWPRLSVQLEIEDRLPRLFDCLLGAAANREESRILSMFQGSNFSFFLTELIKMRSAWSSDCGTAEHCIKSAFLCRHEPSGDFLERFSDFHTWSFKMKNMALQLLHYRNPIALNSVLSVGMIRVALKERVGYQVKWPRLEQEPFTQLSKVAYHALMHDEPGIQHNAAWIKFYAYWKDVLLQYGHFQTECHDQDRFKQVTNILRKIEGRLGNRLAVDVHPRIVLSQPEAVLMRMHAAIDALTIQTQCLEENLSWHTLFERMPITQTGYLFWSISDPVGSLTEALGHGWHLNCTQSFREQVVEYCGMDLPEFLTAYQGMIESSVGDPEKDAALVVSTLCMLPYTHLPTHEVLTVQAHVLGLLRAAMDLESIDHWPLATLANALHSLTFESQQAVYKDIQQCLQSLVDKHVFFENKPIGFLAFEDNASKTYLTSLFNFNHEDSYWSLPVSYKAGVFEVLSSVWLLNIPAKAALVLQETWESGIADCLISMESDIQRSEVLVAIDSLWGSNIPVGDVLGLVQHWEEMSGDKMIGLRPSISARPKEIPALPLVEV